MLAPVAPAGTDTTSVCGETFAAGFSHWQVTAVTEVTHDDKPLVNDTSDGTAPVVLIWTCTPGAGTGCGDENVAVDNYVRAGSGDPGRPRSWP